MISCRHVTRRYDNFTAVEDLSFEVAGGAICVLLGPNGAGKSTTVKMLTGLLEPTSGEITVAGLSFQRNPVELKRRIGVLPENLGLFDDLTVEEHLALTGHIYGTGRQDARARANQLLATLDLEHGRHTFARNCSHGMRKKTALAMALLPNPEVVFLDEPFEAIDPVTSVTIQRLLAAIASRGITVFLATHILSAVERLATQFVLIRHGKIAWNSPAAEISGSLEDHYFDLIEAPVMDDLTWLGSRGS